MKLDVQTLRDRLNGWDDAGGPLYTTLADRLADLVAMGELPPGARLPSERALAAALGVSRGTVVAAYDRLRADGLAETRHGSGTVVRAEASPVTGPRESHVAAALASQGIWSGMLTGDDDTIDMRGAYWMGADDLPSDAFALDRGADAAELLAGHGYRPLGIPGLRAAIARRLSAAGLATEPEQVLVTSGAQQAITLVAELLVGPEDPVVLEELTFPGAIDAFVARQARVRTARLTPHGVDVGHLARVVADADPRVVYLVADCHNPTGTVLPAIARRRIAELTTRWSGVVVDDRTLSGMSLDGSGFPPPIGAFADDPAARIVTIGSMSKAFWGGLRVGWIRAPQRMLSRLARLKTADDLGTAAVSQLAAQRLIDRADEILPRRHAATVERFEVLTDALRRRLPEWEWTDPAGGLCLWVRLPGADSLTFATMAARHGVGVAPGPVSAPAGGWRDHLRLPFGQPPHVLGEAVDRLADAWDDYRHTVDRCDRVSVVV
jgi:DNA-binding transcriptional MocR family regulator